MADENTPSTSTAVVAQQPRPPRIPVEAASAIMDTARFEHLGRVATMMADAQLLPDSLCTYKEGEETKWHTYDTIRARAFMIATQADNWKADPNAVSQCTSLVHNRLMYEGKLVHGIIETRLGVRLRYEFGPYNLRTRDIDPMPENGMDPTDKTLGVRVSAQFSDEDFIRWIAGSVAMWETTGAKSPWSKATAWPRQLRYMGAREWGRAHAPGLLLGILTDDEIEGYEVIQDQRAERAERRKPKPKADLQGKLAGPGQGQGEGFSEAHISRETGQGGHDTLAAPQEPQDAQDTAPAGFDTLTGEVDATEPATGPDSVQGGEGGDTITGQGAVHYDLGKPGGDMTAEVTVENGKITDVRVIEPTASDEQDDGNEWPYSEAHEGPAPMGVVYQLSTDDVGLDDTVQTYKDGQKHQRCDATACEEIPLYDDHPELEEMEPGFPPSDETYHLAGDAWSETTGTRPTYKAGVRTGEAGRQAGVRIFAQHQPGPEPDADAAPAEGGFMAEVQALQTWADITDRLKLLYKTPEWVALPDDDKDAVRAAVWAHVDTLIKAGTIKLDFVTEPAAFNLWQATMEGKEGADAIEGNLGILKKEPKFLAMKAEQQERLVNTAILRINKLKGKG